jgi:molybdopterin molybdotransferase
MPQPSARIYASKMSNPPQMLSVAEARARILEHFHPLPTETIPLALAAGRVLAEDVIAAQPVPPFANSSMDGYAVRLRDVAAASREQPVRLAVSGDIPAGAPIPPPLAQGTAARIMTGAPVPEGAEAVVPVEDTDDRRDHSGAPPPAAIRVFKNASAGANIRPIGQDVRAGQVVMSAGTVLRPAEVGVLAALGRAHVRAHRRPVVAILSTGDELCEVEAEPRPGQIRDTNSYTLSAAVEQYGGRALRLGIARDRAEDVRAKLLGAAERGADLILSSAGVSVGAYDVVKEVVEAEGALDFWRVRMRPGKPVAFGNLRGIPFFGLPGNPVSALVSFEVFVRPALLKMAGHRQLEKPALRAALLEPMRSDGRESYLRVVVERRGEGYAARSTGDQGSAVLTSLVKANGLLIVPEGVTEVKAGEVLPVWLLDDLV